MIDKFSDVENEPLYTEYKIIEQEVMQTRDQIIEVLKNILLIPKDIYAQNHNDFNKTLLTKYYGALTNTPYDVFVEKQEKEEKIRTELYRRIEEIKNNPKNKQLLHLCKNLAGAEIDIDNFREYLRMIEYCEAREGKATHLGLIEPFKDKGNIAQLN